MEKEKLEINTPDEYPAQRLFDDIRKIRPVDSQRDYSAVSKDVLAATDKLNNWIANITPEQILKNKTLSELNKHCLNEPAFQIFLKYGPQLTLIEWKEICELINLKGILSPWKKSRPFKSYPQLAKYGWLDIMDQLSTEEAKILLSNSPINILDTFSPLLETWQNELAQSENSSHQAMLIQSIYHVENPLLQQHGLLGLTIDELFKEWEETNLDDKATLPEEPQKRLALLSKIKNGLGEMALASVTASSAWAYVGEKLPKELISCLFSSDREFSMKLFNDLLNLALIGKLIYPPQLMYLLKFSLPTEYQHQERTTVNDTLRKLYRDGKSLREYGSKLNFMVTGENRSDEYERFISEMLKKTNKDKPALFLFSGPPLDSLLRYKKWGWRGKLVTVDKADQFKLRDLALVIKNELVRHSPILKPEEVAARVEELSGNHYPIENGRWLNHHSVTLPQEMSSLEVEDPSLIVDQRGGSLYLPPAEELQQYTQELELLSKTPGSTLISTRGVVDRLIVDLILQRQADGKMQAEMLESTSSVPSLNKEWTAFLHGTIIESATRRAFNGEILGKDKNRIPIIGIVDILLGQLRKSPLFLQEVRDHLAEKLAVSKSTFDKESAIAFIRFMLENINLSTRELLDKIMKEFPEENEFKKRIKALALETFEKERSMQKQLTTISHISEYLKKMVPQLINARSMQTTKIFHQYADSRFSIEILSYLYFRLGLSNSMQNALNTTGWGVVENGKLNYY